MYKALCIAVLSLPTFVLAQSPQVVAKAKLPHQTATIPTTTIYTPAQTGLYRLSVYATLLTTVENSQSQWNVYVQWTDDAVTQYQNVLFSENSLGSFVFPAVGNYGPSITFESKAGTPISYFVTQSNGADGTSYSLYYTLERVE
jgi:hypothetical protein